MDDKAGKAFEHPLGLNTVLEGCPFLMEEGDPQYNFEPCLFSFLILNYV
ncbi:hypothetical protein [Archaeoglobus sulfaticallidus]|nr:hypothetical protein [Archaeoglobus sulfaticallidus]